ncbi:hypothetical protein B0A54_02623 [Friedmanniomyces endolithicus]|uniref:Uncharacterized protein n=1 Tax=Friedmanniomyces endolithicus TaxID=329885 RepID=A0A4U0VG29_9PEZI|nr:hypothetical protein B0A54_02623 [Friedmanniomyces endolithicus]
MEKCKAASDEDREGDDEDLRPKKIQKKPKRKKHDGAADAKDDPTGLSAAEKHAKELPGLEAALEKEKAVEPDPGIPFRLFGIFCVNVQFSKAKAKGVCGYLDLRNKNETLALDELLAQDLQDFWTIIDNKYGYTSKDAKDQELSGTNLRLDTGKFHGYLQELEDYPRGDCERRNAGRSPIPAREAYAHGSYMSLLASHGPACARRGQAGLKRGWGLP